MPLAEKAPEGAFRRGRVCFSVCGLGCPTEGDLCARTDALEATPLVAHERERADAHRASVACERLAVLTAKRLERFELGAAERRRVLSECRKRRLRPSRAAAAGGGGRGGHVGGRIGARWARQKSVGGGARATV